ncbi:superinfection immunity protein [Candidatus Poriferisodalis sp.]|uniref:superinfection immunity protein n=1 Tax=Candidatus Poriferisodalis sp. TaxID=3101277 RepID=UPI003B012191
MLLANLDGIPVWVAAAFYFCLALLLVSALVGYLLPAIIAKRGEHPDAAQIAVLNFLAGWTVVGWIVALVWALRKPRPQWNPDLRR